MSPRTCDASTLRLLDGLAALWVTLWLVVGSWTGVTIWHLSQLGDTVSSSGSAIESAGEALGSLGDVPVVGEKPLELGQEITVTGADITDRGQLVKGQLRQLALLLGLAVALVPAAPVLVSYVPRRWQRRRDVRDLEEWLRTPGQRDSVDHYLAIRALERLPQDAWREDGGTGPLEVTDSNARALADAELRRLGVRRPG